MKIALINENSQAAKNGIIEAALKKVVEPMGHEVVNNTMGVSKQKIAEIFTELGLEINIRPEKLTIQNLFSLSSQKAYAFFAVSHGFQHSTGGNVLPSYHFVPG